MTTVFSVNYEGRSYFVTKDRRRLGDSRGFDTYEQAMDEAKYYAAIAGYDSATGQRRAVVVPGYRMPKGE